MAIDVVDLFMANECQKLWFVLAVFEFSLLLQVFTKHIQLQFDMQASLL
jgi:hypothetical protein